eukprot:COSAG03_NODE_284_length_9420_cov_67.122090_2_plen_170_part_00
MPRWLKRARWIDKLNDVCSLKSRLESTRSSAGAEGNTDEKDENADPRRHQLGTNMMVRRSPLQGRAVPPLFPALSCVAAAAVVGRLSPVHAWISESNAPRRIKRPQPCVVYGERQPVCVGCVWRPTRRVCVCARACLCACLCVCVCVWSSTVSLNISGAGRILTSRSTS